MEQTIEPIKLLEKLALDAGRRHQSLQTGFIHFYYPSNHYFEDCHHTIPLYENFLFALTLLRTRLVENIQESKELIARLLAFQIKDNLAVFPVYLHDFPVCHDTVHGLHLLAPLFWILRQFGHILGPHLKNHLEQVSERIIELCLKNHATNPFSYFLAVRLAALQLGFGKLLHHESWQNEGAKSLYLLANEQMKKSFSSYQLGHLLASLQINFSSIQASPWLQIWSFIEQTWDSDRGCQLGPVLKEKQAGFEPEANLLDLYCGFYSNQFSKRVLSNSGIFQLEGCLVQASKERFSSFNKPVSFSGGFDYQAWKVIHHKNCSFFLSDKKNDSEHFFTPFKMSFGDLSNCHSFVCQTGSKQIEYSADEVALTFCLIFELEEVDLACNREEYRAIEFFIDDQAASQFSIEGVRTNVFELDQIVTFKCENFEIKLQFSLIEGEGDFFGHIAKGNRASQIKNKRQHRFQAFDSTLFLRSVRQRGSCKIRCKISIKEKL